jgi:hypothetical protein
LTLLWSRPPGTSATGSSFQNQSGIAEVQFVGHWLDALAKASTRHRARHRHIGSGAASSSETGRPDVRAAASETQGLTRRALLRRGAVVGAVVWTTPILQTALAPAASASTPPVCTVSCPPGTPCAGNSNCASGFCQGGICKIPYGGSGTCSGGADCQSGNCDPVAHTCLASWPGVTCTTDSQCLSGKCVGGRCFENSVNGLCLTTADCTDNTTCPAGTSWPRVCGGTGATCANSNKCVSGRCRQGVCVA